jgi:protein-S-isoprenylcysteine O-methyltransferase Ste14
MAVNPFFSATVRIQAERGHTVIARGPYARVRHPGYAGMTLVTLATPVLLGTLWGLVPAGILVAVMVARTVLDDRTLRAELGGYADYAARVKYRLWPGVW